MVSCFLAQTAYMHKRSNKCASRRVIKRITWKSSAHNLGRLAAQFADMGADAINNPGLRAISSTWSHGSSYDLSRETLKFPRNEAKICTHKYSSNWQQGLPCISSASDQAIIIYFSSEAQCLIVWFWVRIWGDACGGVDEFTVKAFQFSGRRPPIEAVHPNLEPVTLLRFYLTVQKKWFFFEVLLYLRIFKRLFSIQNY
jgi:hypothetical protein